MAEIGIDQIQILALASVEHPDWPAQYREICRWYSREFSTPLHVVEQELDRLQILRHYYEDAFKKLKESTDEQQMMRYAEIKENIVFGGLSEEEQAEIEAEDDEWEEQMLREIKEDEAKHRKSQPIQESEPVTTDTLNALNNPNIEDDIEFSVQGEDGPPEF